MPLNPDILRELGLEPEGVSNTPLGLRPDVRGRNPDHPDYDPFEASASEKREMEEMLARQRAARRDLHERIERGPKIDPFKAAREGALEGKSSGRQAGEVLGKPKPANHNARTKALLEGMGYTFYKADYYDARTGRAHDLCGVFDGLAFGPEGVVGVQLTSVANMAARRKKIGEWADLAAWKAAGAKVLLVGWKKGKSSGRFEEKVEWL